MKQPRKYPKVKATENGGVTAEHILIVEKAWGRKLPEGAVVHHFDENHKNNSQDNLVLCPDRAYHNFLHQRQRALRECGHADWHKCPYCKTFDDPANMVPQKRYDARKVNNPALMHAECKRDYMRTYLKTDRKADRGFTRV